MEAIDRLRVRLRSLTRADLTLASLPFVFLTLFGLGVILTETLAMAAAIASVGSSLLLADGLFLNAPTSD